MKPSTPKSKHQSIRLSGLVLLLSLSVLSPESMAQNRTPQDVRRVTVTSKYTLENGIRKNEYFAIHQEIYDSLGRLHTEVEFDETDKYPHNYRWHTFIGQQKVKTEFFRNEKLVRIKKFSFDANGNLSKKEIYEVSPGDTSLHLTIRITYNQTSRPLRVEAKNSKGKLAYKLTSTYDNAGTELARKASLKKGYSPPDSVIKLKCTPKYDSLGRLASVNKVIVNLKKQTIRTEELFTYDSKGNLTGIRILNDKGEQISREERVYQEGRNRVSQLKYFDANDQIVRWLGKRYEIYRTPDRRIRELEY